MKVYDPILCMMVEKPSVKTNDEKKTFIVNVYVNGKNVKFASSAMSANGAILEARKKYPQGLVWGVDRATAKDADKCVEKVKTTDGKFSKIFDNYPALAEMVKDRLTNTKYKSDSDFYRAVEKAKKEVQKAAQQLEDAYNEAVADYNRAKNRLNTIYNELHNDKLIEFIRGRNVN